jgi:hypothetical protein
LLVLVVEECSVLEEPLGELSFEFEDDDECSVVVVAGGAGAGTTTTRAGATTTGAAYTIAGAAGAVVVVELELVVSVESASKRDTPPNNAAMPKDRAAVFNEKLIMRSPLVPGTSE